MTQWVDLKEIEEMEKRYRAQFINSITGAKGLHLVGTVDKSGQENLSVISSCLHLGSNPALLAMIIRPRIVPRHTMDNILETGQWTLNHINESIITKGHQTSARYPKELSEFEATGLTPLYRDTFVAPFVKESHFRIGCQYLRHIKIEENDTEMVIGQVQSVYLNQSWVAEDGSINLAKAGTVTVTGLDSYHHLSPLVRLSYAKPGKEPIPIGEDPATNKR